MRVFFFLMGNGLTSPHASTSTNASTKLSFLVTALLQMVPSLLLLLGIVTMVQPLPRPQGATTPSYPETPGPPTTTAPTATPSTTTTTRRPEEHTTERGRPVRSIPTVISPSCASNLVVCGHECCPTGPTVTECPPLTISVGGQCIPLDF